MRCVVVGPVRLTLTLTLALPHSSSPNPTLTLALALPLPLALTLYPKPSQDTASRSATHLYAKARYRATRKRASAPWQAQRVRPRPSVQRTGPDCVPLPNTRVCAVAPAAKWTSLVVGSTQPNVCTGQRAQKQTTKTCVRCNARRRANRCRRRERLPKACRGLSSRSSQLLRAWWDKCVASGFLQSTKAAIGR